MDSAFSARSALALMRLRSFWLLFVVALLSVAEMNVRAEEAPPRFRWATPVGGQGLGSLFVDDIGYVYITRESFSADVTVGTNTIPYTRNHGIFVVAKCDRAGNLIWGLQDGTDTASAGGI